MAEPLDTIKSILAVVGPIAGCGGIWAYLAERQKSRTPLAVAIADSQAAIADAVATQTKLIMDEHARDRNDLRRIVARQGRKLEKLSRDVVECNKHHRACEENLTYVRGQISQMMSDAAAGTLVVNPHPLKDQVDVAD